MSIQILIAEDRHQFHHQLKDFIQTRNRQVGLPDTAGVEQGGIEFKEEHLSNILMQDGNDFQALQALYEKFPGMVITVLAFPESCDAQLQVVELGTEDWAGKTIEPIQLLGAIEKLLQNKAAASNHKTTGVQKDLSQNDDKVMREGIEPLTNREQEVLRLIAVGKSNAVVAKELAISLNTVKSHVRNILRKVQLKNRTEAANYALTHGYMS